MEPYIGEIKLVPYNFAPNGWAFCDGSLLAISANQALFSLLGTTYGGDGISTFAIPDLRGQVALSMGQGSGGGSNYQIGQRGGVESVTLTSQQIPAHVHSVAVSASAATLSSPANAFLAVAEVGVGNVFTDVTKSNVPGGNVLPTGGNGPHENVQPFLALNYVIALQGIYPSRN